jgi:hypothetical protein
VSAEKKPAKAILFSADPTIVNISDAIAHLQVNRELYWATGLRISRKNIQFPILGFINISGQGGCFLAEINNVIAFRTEHFNDASVKPRSFRDRWEQNPKERLHPWKCVLVMTSLNPFFFDTYELKKLDGSVVKKPLRGYARVVPPINTPMPVR